MHREMHSYKKCQFSLVFVKVPKFLMHVCISIFFFKRGIIFGASKSYDHFFSVNSLTTAVPKVAAFVRGKRSGRNSTTKMGFHFPFVWLQPSRTGRCHLSLCSLTCQVQRAVPGFVLSHRGGFRPGFKFDLSANQTQTSPKP